MPINVRDALYEKGDDLRGAVFLTYSLNLNFFEQLVVPKLNMAGCSHMVIIADAFGYDEALAQGSRTLNGVGTRYVCSPLINPGSGVQHAKMVLLIGPRQGRLLIGSGNLTLAGYGRNMELFNRFDVRFDGDATKLPTMTAPFITAWQILTRLQQTGELSRTAMDQLNAIQELAPWLNETTARASETNVWHSLERSIYSRLHELGPVRELQIIAPFQHLDTIQALARHFRPRQLTVGVDSIVPNLDGVALAQRSASWGCSLELRSLSGREGHRALHAKAIIGIHDGGAWCVTGSANCTPPALLHAWRHGGNLELVTWQSSDDPAAFQPIWQDQLISMTVQDPSAVTVSDTGVGKPSDPVFSPLRLLELSYQIGTISGLLEHSRVITETGSWELELLRRRQSLPILLDDTGRFSVSLETALQGSEAGRAVLRLGDGSLLASPYHWIDQPAELARYGRRTYYARVRESLSTFDGAGKLFEELMNYLWERVDPQAIHNQQGDHPGSTRRSKHTQSQEDGDPLDEAPPPESFITEEQLVNTLADWVEYDWPFDRSTVSLRDLLSLALLRLTTETVPPDTDVGEDSERNEDEDAQRVAELEKQQRTALEQLRAYLLSYCSRYARRLADSMFVAQIGPRLLFENNYTLGRALLEVADKVDVFTKQDLRRTALQLLGGMFWPECVQLSGPGGWTALVAAGHSPDDLRQLWDMNELTPLAMTFFLEGWSDPIPWDIGLYDERNTQLSLRTKKLIEHIEHALGPRFWEPWSDHSVKQHDVWGFRTLAALDGNSDTVYPFDDAGDRCARLARYLTPVVEKYRDLWRLQRLIQRRQGNSAKAVRLTEHIQEQGYTRELELFRELPNASSALPMVGDSSDCPGCFIGLPTRVAYAVREGQLVLCPNCRRTVLYWEPRLNLELDTW